MEIKFIISKSNGDVSSFLQILNIVPGTIIWTSFRISAHRYDSYPEAEEFIKNIKEPGIYQIEKIFIKK